MVWLCVTIPAPVHCQHSYYNGPAKISKASITRCSRACILYSRANKHSRLRVNCLTFRSTSLSIDVRKGIKVAHGLAGFQHKKGECQHKALPFFNSNYHDCCQPKLTFDYIMSMPPPGGPAGAFSFSGMSVTRAEVVRIMEAMEQAFSTALRVTLTGSIMPACSIST